MHKRNKGTLCHRGMFTAPSDMPCLIWIFRVNQLFINLGLGLPATTFRESLGTFKGSSLIRNCSCAELFCFALCPCYSSVLGSVLSDNVSFSCTFSGMLAHYSSNRFTQRPILVVLHVSSTLVVGSLANSVDVF